MSQDKEERKLKKVKIALMRRKELAMWHGLLMVGSTSIDDNLPTACTDGRDDIYGRKFVRDLSDKELAFVIMHETLHKAFRHLTTWAKLSKENHQLTNAACDYVINPMLVDMDPQETYMAFPREKDGTRIGLYDARFRGMNTKRVYDILKQEQEEGGGGPGEGFDEHDWNSAQSLSEEDKKILEREIDQAIRQGQMQDAKLNGNKAGSANRELGELLSPKVDWREALREFVTSTCSAKDTSSWRRVNRRFLYSDVYMPTLIGERVGHIVVGVDTSGSISGREISRFLSEVKSIAEDVHPEKVDLIYWDAAVASHETYAAATLSTLIQSTKPQGGGGTDPRCVSKYLKDKVIRPECIIMLTDGYIGSWGDDWEVPIMWVIVGGNKTLAPVGKTIHVED
jgi:predicted metal-dependent peptidase